MPTGILGGGANQAGLRVLSHGMPQEVHGPGGLLLGGVLHTGAGRPSSKDRHDHVGEVAAVRPHEHEPSDESECFNPRIAFSDQGGPEVYFSAFFFRKSC